MWIADPVECSINQSGIDGSCHSLVSVDEMVEDGDDEFLGKGKKRRWL